MGKYVNPIPYVDKYEKYVLRLSVKYDEPIEVEKAKELAADYIQNMARSELINCLHEEKSCT